MKKLAIAAITTLGFSVVSTPAQAALLGWNVEYTGWWEEVGGGSVSGMFTAEEADAADGIVSINEMASWTWSWSGNETVPAFSIASSEAGATSDFSPSFYVDGRPNLPLEGLDQGSFISGSGNQIIDLEALLVFTDASDVNAPFAEGNSGASLGMVSVSEPVAVPEPAALLGLIALAGVGASTLKPRQEV